MSMDFGRTGVVKMFLSVLLSPMLFLDVIQVIGLGHKYITVPSFCKYHILKKYELF